MTKAIKEQIQVMQHYANGGEVEFMMRGRPPTWMSITKPTWNWHNTDYHIYVKEPELPSIDWSHVSDKYNWLAVDEDGVVWLYVEKPFIRADKWGGGVGFSRAGAFASLKIGNCDWKDSLVERPAKKIDDNDGWIDWEGGTNPVGEQLVSLKFADEQISNNVRASQYVWKHYTQEDDIIAYKLA